MPRLKNVVSSCPALSSKNNLFPPRPENNCIFAAQILPL